MGGGGWVAGLSKTKTKPNPKLKFELKFGAELCKNCVMKKCVEPKMFDLSRPRAISSQTFLRVLPSFCCF